MSCPRSLGAALVLLALCACGNPEREKKEQETAAAEKKLAETRTFREGLERERALLSQQLTEVRAQADAASSAYHRTLAAAAYLAELEGSELKPDGTMLASLHAARAGFQLEEATRKKDSAALHTLATGLLDAERPCVPAKKEETQAQEDSPEEDPYQHPCSSYATCEAEPYEDACKDVPAELSMWPAWTCDTLTRTEGSLPTTAFCRATFEHPETTSAGSSTYSVDGLATSQVVVRIAFEHGGRLYVSDFPSPSAELYNPPNTTGQAECAATTQQNACVHQCDKDFGRYEDPCACVEDAHDDHGEEGDHDDSEESDEPYEVREARLAAERAEAEAAQAQADAEAAQQELRYQECLAACQPEQDEPVATVDENGNPLPPVPDSVESTARLETSPAPGIFVVTVDTRTLAADGKEIQKTATTHVLEHQALTEMWAGNPPSNPDTVGGLGSLYSYVEFEDVLREGNALSLSPLPGMQGAMVVGLSGEKVVAVRFSKEKGQELVETLDTKDVCEAMKQKPKRFPAAYLEACDKQPAPAPAVAAPAVEDAGTEGKVAGEVTP